MNIKTRTHNSWQFEELEDGNDTVWLLCEGCNGNGKYCGHYESICNKCLGHGKYWVPAKKRKEWGSSGCKYDPLIIQISK